MPSGSRFVVGAGTPAAFSLNHVPPWDRFVHRPSRNVAIVGWRYVCKVYPIDVNSARAFVERQSHNPTRLVRGREIRIRGEQKSFGLYDTYLVVDIWARQRFRDIGDLRDLRGVVEQARREVAFELSLQREQDLQAMQEFFACVLPTFLARRLNNSVRARTALGALLERDGRAEDSLASVRLEGRLLQLGPEPPGALAAVQLWLEQEDHNRGSPAAPAPSRLANLVPLAMALVVLSSWAAPLRPRYVTLLGAIAALLLTLGFLPARRSGIRRTITMPSTIAAIGFFAIAAFGIAYSVCAIVDPGSLGHDVKSLGYPFLVATGLGVAGGILGDNPTGAARVIAHLQLLLFLGGLAGVVSVLLGIHRASKRGPE